MRLDRIDTASVKLDAAASPRKIMYVQKYINSQILPPFNAKC